MSKGARRALAALPPATSRLTFRSLPYASSNHLMFPPSGTVNASYTTPFFSLRCFPSPSRTPNSPPRPLPRSSLKHEPTPPPTCLPLSYATATGEPELEEHRVRRLTTFKHRHKPYTMDLTIFVGKAKVHKSAVIRETCRRRLKEAIKLVVVRGAVSDLNEGLQFDGRKEGVGKWLLPGFSYIAGGNLELYRRPMPDLVKAVSEALTHLKRRVEPQLLARQLDVVADELKGFSPTPERTGDADDNQSPFE